MDVVIYYQTSELLSPTTDNFVREGHNYVTEYVSVCLSVCLSVIFLSESLYY